MDEPGLVYKYMFESKIGTSLAIFYKAWAKHCFKSGKQEEVNEVLALGVKCNSELFSTLEEFKK